MTSDFLPAVQIETAPNPEASVIWMHGLGADGNDFVPIVQELDLAVAPAIRFIFPHAPMQPVTINGGYVMRAWYDIAAADLGHIQDEIGIRRSQKEIEKLIARERELGIDPSRIVLAGFSQGGAIALHTGLRYPERVAGILALSSYVPIAHTVAAEAHPANAGVPIFMAHGVQDNVIPFAFGSASRDFLKQHGYPVEWHEYFMPHSVCMEEIADIGAFLTGILAEA
jgi:phospholipase/carboxylesterase